MKKLLNLSAVGFGLVSLAGCSSGTSTETSTETSTDSKSPAVSRAVPEVVSEDVLPKGTTNFTSQSAGFSIYLPTKPTEKTVPSAANKQGLPIQMFQAEARPITYVVLAIEIPSGAGTSDVAAFFKGVEGGFAQGGRAKIEKRRDIMLGTVPGRELHTSTHNGAASTRVRAFLADGKTYQVMAVGLKKDAQKQQAQIDKVLDSFRIIQK